MNIQLIIWILFAFYFVFLSFIIRSMRIVKLRFKILAEIAEKYGNKDSEEGHKVLDKYGEFNQYKQIFGFKSIKKIRSEMRAII